jgi:hypothetical protein
MPRPDSEIVAGRVLGRMSCPDPAAAENESSGLAAARIACRIALPIARDCRLQDHCAERIGR